MSGKASGKSRPVKAVRVRFISPVKTAGRWYMAGDVARVSATVAADFLKRGLVEKPAGKPGSGKSKKPGG